MGYGVVTDWWARGTEPTVSCQMHTTQTICPESGMLASAYCPYPVTRSVVMIPSGHPLYNLLGQYADVIREYLGTSAVTSTAACTLHNEFTPQQPQTPSDGDSFAEARQVLAMADMMLASMDPGSDKYLAIQNAADYLRLLLGAAYPDQVEIMAAMEALTRAMGGIY
jgi:penicillin-binding protein 1A